MGFPGGSDGRESAFNVGDPSSIPGSRRSPGEGNGYPLQYSCLYFRGQRSLVGYSPWGCKELDMTEWLTHTTLKWIVKNCYNNLLSSKACHELKLHLRLAVTQMDQWPQEYDFSSPPGRHLQNYCDEITYFAFGFMYLNFQLWKQFDLEGSGGEGGGRGDRDGEHM